MFLPYKVVLERRVALLAIVPVALMALGTFGYRFIEGWDWIDAVYMTVITLTTVGYREVHPMSAAGTWFTMFLALAGIFAMFYFAMEVVRLVISGEVRQSVQRLRMARELEKLAGHVVVCGYGRMGRLVCRQLAELGQAFVVVEKDAAALEDFTYPLPGADRTAAGAVALHGDATQDDLLRRAGVDRARALVTVLATDSDNLYITMSARLLNPTLFIVARSEDQACENKLLRAGANRVVSPYHIGGNQMAQAIVRPNVVDFIELATKTEHLELQIEETTIAESSSLVGMTVSDSRIRQRLGLIVVAVKQRDGKMVYNPLPDYVLRAGDILIVLGDRPHLDEFERVGRGESGLANG